MHTCEDPIAMRGHTTYKQHHMIRILMHVVTMTHIKHNNKQKYATRGRPAVADTLRIHLSSSPNSCMYVCTYIYIYNTWIHTYTSIYQIDTWRFQNPDIPRRVGMGRRTARRRGGAGLRRTRRRWIDSPRRHGTAVFRASVRENLSRSSHDRRRRQVKNRHKPIRPKKTQSLREAIKRKKIYEQQRETIAINIQIKHSNE